MILEGIPISEDECIGDSLDTINNAFVSLSTTMTVTVSSGVPWFAPSRIGQEYLNSVTGIFFKASATNTAGDWAALN